MGWQLLVSGSQKKKIVDWVDRVVQNDAHHGKFKYL